MANKKKVTYYLFGGSACNELECGIQNCLDYCKESGDFSVFAFVEGETSSVDFISSFLGWSDYSIINKNEYDSLVNI